MTDNLYALLIGVDCYFPNILPDGQYIPSLGGCVNDVRKIEVFLKQKLKIKSEKLIRLTASNIGGKHPPELSEFLPTYENIVSSFQKISKAALPGDQVYIHYSGHGGRIPTKFPMLKDSGVDESLVPWNICDPRAQHLRDLELAYLLHEMVKKELVVTIILDSCHSGGMVRGDGGPASRSLGEVDRTKRSSKSLVAPDTVLAETWRSLSFDSVRSLELGNGWLPAPKGYVLISACRPSEKAYEWQFNGRERNGVLSYWLLDSLERMTTGLTYQQIYNRVVAKVNSQFKLQNPQLQGEMNRLVFGNSRVRLPSGVNVTKVDFSRQRIQLNTGQSQSIRCGTKFEIFPYSSVSNLKARKRLAVVEISELGSTTSWAKVIEKFGQIEIQQGDQAVLLTLDHIRLYRKVGLAFQNSVASAERTKIGELVHNALKSHGKGFLISTANVELADYRILINDAEEFEILDLTGQPISNLNPTIYCNDENSATLLTKRLIHLTKYSNVLNLRNASSSLSNKVTLDLLGVQSDYDPMDAPEPIPFEDIENSPVLKPGDWTFLKIKNQSSQVLNIAVLNLQSDWGITQIYPSQQDTDFWPIDPGEHITLPLQAYLPHGHVAVTDTIKVFSTVGSASFRWLELPPIAQLSSPNNRGVDTFQQRPQNTLEQFLLSVAPPVLKQRNISLPTNYDWTTAQVTINVKV